MEKEICCPHRFGPMAGRAQPLLYGAVVSTKPGPCGSDLSILRNVFHFILTVLKCRMNIPRCPSHVHLVERRATQKQAAKFWLWRTGAQCEEVGPSAVQLGDSVLSHQDTLALEVCKTWVPVSLRGKAAAQKLNVSQPFRCPDRLAHVEWCVLYSSPGRPSGKRWPTWFITSG